MVESGFSDHCGCPIYSLHGSTRTPTKDMLSNIDLLIIDVQEVGMRCYTYISTVKSILQAAKENNIELLLLERPNPIKFLGAHGPLLQPEFESFVGKVNVPFIHGTTLGEIAKKENRKIGAMLTILNCKNIDDNNDYFLYNFISPSPNLNSINAVYTYPLTVLIEGTNYSEGRGTVYPFQQIGAPWVDGQILANSLNSKLLNGVFFESVTFTPKGISGMAENPKHNDLECGGVFIHVYDRKSISPLKISQTILRELFTMYPEKSQLDKWGKKYGIDLLIGNDQLRKWLMRCSGNNSGSL